MSIIKLPKEICRPKKETSWEKSYKREREKDLNASEGRMTTKIRIGVQRRA